MLTVRALYGQLSECALTSESVENSYFGMKCNCLNFLNE